MFEELELQDAVDRVRQVLDQTYGGKIEWTKSPKAGVFVSRRTKASAVLDTVSGPTSSERLVRLRFSRGGESDYSTVIQQHSVGGSPLPGELERDAFLARLYQIVVDRVGRTPTAADEFLSDE